MNTRRTTGRDVDEKPNSVAANSGRNKLFDASSRFGLTRDKTRHHVKNFREKRRHSHAARSPREALFCIRFDSDLYDLGRTRIKAISSS